ncbi:septum site-determining protein MinC [Robertmurraya sp. DFI.2.37]|uniref:septum site-determining protein MinC n=1 Tax=Robertmurraya sp. DFI.2.37 TaxID=3031819 RepID=UPI001246C02F|nr:septum site-determining protein MinC [Robertmurraya sp. DFI.2.37]MDF1506871.1 septum site-determining protein MinC [Robertmurraya sp. DFI.2.37]
MKKTQNVLIKGTKDGLTLHLDDSCSYEELKRELNEKLTENQRVNNDHPLISVSVKVGNRYLTDEQKEEIKTLIRQKKNLVVESIESNVLTKLEAKQIMEEHEIVSVARIVRSGQVLEVPGDLLLIGDVNPGGKVVAGGNVFVMGALKGIAHAGANGNSNAIISASIMMPTQLRINEAISRSPDVHGNEERREMECAYIDENEQIIIDRLQVLMHLRPNLTRLEGGF